MSKNLFALAALVTFFPKMVLANDVAFSIGSGFPYVLSAEAAYVTNSGKRRWYGNYKASIDSGFSLGMENSMSENNKHALGFFLGAVGLKKGKAPCDNEEVDNLIVAALCGVADAYEWDSLRGLGVTYSYSFNTLSRNGWKLGTGLGYGKSNSEVKGFTGQLNFSYQF